jgi:hypothetical protein
MGDFSEFYLVHTWYGCPRASDMPFISPISEKSLKIA